jgi:hypothetical protein
MKESQANNEENNEGSNEPRFGYGRFDQAGRRSAPDHHFFYSMTSVPSVPMSPKERQGYTLSLLESALRIVNNAELVHDLRDLNEKNK